SDLVHEVVAVLVGDEVHHGAGVLPVEVCEQRQQEVRGQGGRDGDVDGLLLLSVQREALCGIAQGVQRVADVLEVMLAVFGQGDGIVLANEQRHPQVGLQIGDVAADGALRHEQLQARFREAQVPRGRVEGLQLGDGRTAFLHGSARAACSGPYYEYRSWAAEKLWFAERWRVSYPDSYH